MAIMNTATMPEDEEQLFKIMWRMNNEARCLYAYENAEALDAAGLLTVALSEAWSTGHQPERVLPGGGVSWSEVLYGTYSVDGKQTEPPTEPLTLYRGCAPFFVRGMSWTSDLAVAQSFATGEMPWTTPGKVYRLDDVPPDALRMHLTERQESEYVLCAFWLDGAEPVEHLP